MSVSRNAEGKAARLRFSASINLLFQELPPADRVLAAASAGFSAIELQDFTIEKPSVIADAARSAGIKVALINVPLGDLLSGGQGLSGVEGREREFRDVLALTHEAARILKPECVNIGAFRRDGAAACWPPVYESNIEAAAALFASSGVMPLIEPMNEADIPGVAPASLSLAAGLIRRSFKGRVGLQYDGYHAARRGEDIAEGFAAYADIIRHIQVSDCPGRHEPGTGTLDYPAFFRRVRASGYPHYIGAEYKPLTSTDESFAWLRGEL